MTSVWTKLKALWNLVNISDADYHGYMDSYGELFSRSPECTAIDYLEKKPMEGYSPGSSGALQIYYKVIHWLCTLGSVEKMYMPPCIDPEKSVADNQVLLEEDITTHLKVDQSDLLLDLGCGCGAVARNISTTTGAAVYGINLEESQIVKAKQFSNDKDDKCCFSIGDFNAPLKFGDNMFDGAYAIQPLTYMSEPVATLREIHRVLKPGGRLVVNDVAALDAYDKNNSIHKELIQHTRELTGFGGFWHYSYWNDAFTQAGFNIVLHKSQSAVEMIKKEKELYDWYNKTAEFLASWKILPRKVDLLLKRMNTNCSSYIEAEEKKLLSLNYYWVVEKPIGKKSIL